MIDEYHVDWILQDGQNMVKQCTKSTHTHDPADSNLRQFRAGHQCGGVARFSRRGPMSFGRTAKTAAT